MDKTIQTRTCKQCSSHFDINQEDLDFYDKISPVFGGKKYQIPSPTLCPDCRQQRRLSFRNERNLYKRKCDATGKEMISIYSPDKPHTVYSADFWWSDNWDPMSYGRDFDFSKKFSEQFQQLWVDVPVPNRTSDESTMENSNYCNEGGNLKNCYLCFESGQCEDCMYCRGIIFCKDCIDCVNAEQCHGCYRVVESKNLHTCRYMFHCRDCSDSEYLYNCTGTQYCFLSSNLVNAKYYFKNVEYSPEEYKKQLKQYYENTNTSQRYQDFLRLMETSKKRDVYNFEVENVVGDYLYQSKDCYMCFSCSESENCRYCDGLLGGAPNTWCMDVSNYGMGANYSYESQSIGGNPGTSHKVLFSSLCWGADNLLYCYYCIPNNKHCFGCIGLKNKNYCIFNKQYTKQEYETLVPKIIKHMQKTGEWGEFFPSSISPFGYNETVAQEYFGLEKDGAGEKGFCWSEYQSPVPKVEKIIPANTLPENIKDIPDDILNWAIECENTKNPFRVISQELKFYRKYNISIPKRSPDERYNDMMGIRNSRKLYARKCETCDKEIQTTYDTIKAEKIYCETCYNQEIYG